MAAVGKRQTVGAAAAIIVPAGMRGILRNQDGANSVDLGGSGVTAGNGFELKFGQTVEIVARMGEDVYAIRSIAADVRVDAILTRA